MLIKTRDVVSKLQEEFPSHAPNMRLIYEFFWEELKNEMKDFSHIVFKIPKIGNFQLTQSKIDMLENTLKKYDENYEAKIENVKNLIKKRHETKNKKRELRKTYLEEQTKNIGGDVV